MYRVVSLNTYK